MSEGNAFEGVKVLKGSTENMAWLEKGWADAVIVAPVDLVHKF